MFTYQCYRTVQLCCESVLKSCPFVIFGPPFYCSQTVNIIYFQACVSLKWDFFETLYQGSNPSDAFIVEFVSHCVRILIIHITTSSSYATPFGCNGNCKCILFILTDKICIGDNPYSLCTYTYVCMTHYACQNSIV